MKKLIFLASSVFLVSFACLVSCNLNQQKTISISTAEIVKVQYLKRVSELDSIVNRLIGAAKSCTNENQLQYLFHEARYAYKRTEYITELYFPYTAKSLNGPPIDEVESDDPNQIIIPPEGFQVIEELMFPNLDADNKEKLVLRLEQLRSNVRRLKSIATATTFTDSHIFDALRLEVFRIITLGISGFDSPVALNSIPEAKEALKELVLIYNIYSHSRENKNNDDVRLSFNKAINFLNQNKNFNSFDRLNFITSCANTLSEHLLKKQQELKIPVFDELRLLSPGAKTLFSRAAFDLNAFSPAYNKSPTIKQVALGEMLFFDPVLSGDNSRACASCHLPEKGFSDGMKTSTAFGSQKEVLRNAPTIINAGLQASLFYDGRVVFLEDQVTDVVLNVDEMHGDFDKAVHKLNSSYEYGLLFQEAFGEIFPTINEKAIRMALASYVRSKTSMDSPFDRYIRGESSSLTTLEKNGFNLFMGKAACGTCHFMPLFNGTVPPAYKVSESEILGVPATNDTLSMTLDTDLGKFNLYQKELHKFAFKTPTVRNIALTAPYMHNGVYETLEEVMDFYNKGGGQGMGLSVPHQTLAADRLELSDYEIKAIIGFMNSLTDTTGLVGRPHKLPVFKDNSDLANVRTVGGLY